MPVSWQIGRCPSAHMRELVRICAIASLAAGLCSRSYAAPSALDVVERVVVRDVLQRVRDGLDEVVLPDGGGHPTNLRRLTPSGALSARRGDRAASSAWPRTRGPRPGRAPCPPRPR